MKLVLFRSTIGLMVFALLNLLVPNAFAQASTPGGEGTLSGIVTDDQGPVIGAAVTVKGGSFGVTTGMDGDYSLSGLNKNDIIVVSLLGYADYEFTYTGQATQDVVLQVSSEFLEDAVVTALGIKRSEKSLSYNVQEMKGDELVQVKDANFMNSMVGKVAGVTINAGANGPGGASRVVMRGVKSITGSNQALYVIDGVPMFNLVNSASNASYMSDQPGTDGVADINPEDIESISMLTGPSAAALYGNAAASGVVLITTKKGTAGKTTVTVSNNTTFSNVYMMPEMQSIYGNAAGAIASWSDVEVNSSYNPRDFFNTGTNVINSVSLSTGTEKNQTYLSVSTTNTTGVLPNSGYNRYNFTGRNTSKFAKDKLTLDLGASYVMQDDKNMTSQGIYYNPLPGLYLFPRGEDFNEVRMYERYNETLGYNEVYWPYGNDGVGMQNPYWVQNRELRENQKKRYMLSASLDYKPVDWFNITGRVKVDNYTNRLTYKLYATTDRIWAGPNGTYRDINAFSSNVYADVIATFQKEWSGFGLNANIGASINDTQYEQLGYNGQLANLPNFFAIHNLDRTTKYKPTQSGWHDQTQAIFANVELSWKQMLYLTVTGRNDWESRLAFSRYKSFFYPSVGLSAVVSNMFNAPQWLNLLKVRGSYSEVGNSYDRFMTKVFYKYDEESNSWTTSTTFPNTDLKPERTSSWEVGLNTKLFNSLHFDFTYYRSNTRNQTFNIALPASSGYKDMNIQSGNVMNQGIEMAIGYSNVWGDFSFSTDYTLTWNQNRIEKLYDKITNPFDPENPIELKGDRLDKGTFGGIDAKLMLKEGGSMGDIYGFHRLQKDEKTGTYLNKDGNVVLGATDEFLGSILPDTNMGWSTHFGWKGIDLGITFSARFGGIVMSSTESFLDRYGVSQRSADARKAGGVKLPDGQIADAKDYYTTISGQAAYYTYDADNIRLQELSLSYTLPKKWFNDKLRMTVGFVGRNLWMIYCDAPFDPEVSADAASNFYQGFDSFMLPSTRNVGFNVKLQF